MRVWLTPGRRLLPDLHDRPSVVAQSRRAGSAGGCTLCGQITITLAVNLGRHSSWSPALTCLQRTTARLSGRPKEYHVFLIFLGMTILCNLVASLAEPVVAFARDLSLPAAAIPSPRRVPFVLTPLCLGCRYVLEHWRRDRHRCGRARRRSRTAAIRAPTSSATSKTSRAGLTAGPSSSASCTRATVRR